MESIIVTCPDHLDRVPLHDAWFDSDEVVHDPSARTLTLRFAQEPGPTDGVPEPQLVRKARLSTEQRVAFLDWLLVIHNVGEVRAQDGWADMGMLEGLTFDSEQREVSIASNGVMRVTIETLHLEAHVSAERIRWMRRKVGLLGLTSDSPWPTSGDVA